jgi:Flp pilus assembly protein TadG
VKKRLQTFISDCSGAMAVMVVMLLTLLLSAAALGIDYGHMAWVQSELKKAAEAGALAGARALVPYTGTPATPNWTQAQSAATQTVLLNRVNTQLLTDCTVNYGYWSLTVKTLPLQSSGINPTARDVPAVHVQIAKSAGQNGGPLQMMFAPIFGVQTFDLSGQAVAMISFPSGMPVGAVFPLAAAQSIVNQYWTRNPPISFRIGSGSSNGQWTSFKVNNQSASYIKGLITKGNPTVLNVNNNIYIQTGVVASNYGDAASHVGQTVVIPLVASLASGTERILGFVAFKIEAVSQPGKYIQGHFDKDFEITNAVGTGRPPRDSPSTSTPPKLVY